MAKAAGGDAIKQTELLGTSRRTRMIGLLRERGDRERFWIELVDKESQKGW